MEMVIHFIQDKRVTCSMVGCLHGFSEKLKEVTCGECLEAMISILEQKLEESDI